MECSNAVNYLLRGLMSLNKRHAMLEDICYMILNFASEMIEQTYGRHICHIPRKFSDRAVCLGQSHHSDKSSAPPGGAVASRICISDRGGLCGCLTD